MTFKLEIRLDNNAMQSPRDVAHILSSVVQAHLSCYVDTDPFEGWEGEYIKDKDGNRIGDWAVLEK